MNERGGILPILGLIAATIMIALTCLSLTVQNAKRISRQSFKRDTENIATSLKMIYQKRMTCKLNIGDAFGNSIQQLRDKSLRDEIKVMLPTGSMTSAETRLQKDLQYSNFNVESVRFELPLKRPFNDNVYLATLQVQLANQVDTKTPASERVQLRLPVYLLTNGSGAISDCFFTTFTDETLALIREDTICTKHLPKSAKYSPEKRICIVTPSAIAASH